MEREEKTAAPGRELESLVREFFQKKNPAVMDHLPPGFRPILFVKRGGLVKLN